MLDLLQENQAAAKGMELACRVVLNEARKHLKILDPELENQSLFVLLSWYEMCVLMA